MKTVKEISELTGISVRALRYYDEIGLLIPTERSNAGYRLYDEKALKKLNAIMFLRELDVPLDSIKEIVNAEDSDYAMVLRDYRKNLVQKISRLQGLLEVLDGVEETKEALCFEGFELKDVEKVAEVIVKSQDVNVLSEFSEIYELVKCNMMDGKAGNEILQIYGNKNNYLSAVEENARHPEVIAELQEELKNIYFAFRDMAGNLDETQEIVKQLEENTKKMYRTANARFILLKIAEDYMKRGKTAQVIDSVYGIGVTETIGKAIFAYYGYKLNFKVQ